MDASERAVGAAREAEDSKTMDVLARVGMGARAAVWLVIAFLGLQLALGRTSEADTDGALKALAGQPFGAVLLVILAAGFLAHSVWQAASAAVGHTDSEGMKRTATRVLSAGKAVLYVFLAFSTVRILVGGGSGGDAAKTFSATLMKQPGGRFVVALAGLVVIVVAVVLAVRGARQDFADDLELERVPEHVPARAVGTAGFVGQAALYSLVGLFLLRAAWQFDPDEAKGLDAALQSLSQQPFGVVLVSVAVLCVLAYAVWCVVQTAYRKT